jgi:hypothetical protein
MDREHRRGDFNLRIICYFPVMAFLDNPRICDKPAETMTSQARSSVRRIPELCEFGFGCPQ